MKPAVEVNGLSRRFGALQAVENLSFTVFSGDVFGFLGPNGSGKTTTIRMMLGLIARDEGEVKFFGDLSADSLSARQRIGAMVEIPQFFLSLSARKNLEILASYYGKVEKKRLDEVLSLVGLLGRAEDKVGGYSQGMRQRLGIAQAIFHKPEFVILDEPTNGLDPAGIAEMRNLVRRLAESEKMTFLVSSHLLHEIEIVANRVVVINEGRKVAEGGVAEFLAGDGYVVCHARPVEKAVEIIKKLDFIEAIERADAERLRLKMKADAVGALVKALVEGGADVREVSPARRTLEDFFIEKTGRRGG